MQFVANGPDIPDALLLAHEEGRVVFFCGAGISYPAGLPGFGGLVKDIYKILGADLTDIEARALKKEQFDATLDLLERRLPGERLAVRRAIAERLQPDLTKVGAIDTHSALLHLARNRDGVMRLVTTNFDRVFEDAAAREKQTLQSYSAPMLPVPKSSRWNGLVYLHGRLPEDDSVVALNRLVVTSGDFGLAYLTERWAARFVSDLFRNYVICFLGYSINDPVMRYMMDALAADRRQGEQMPTAWAFGECGPDDEEVQRDEWEAKGVTPILYRVENHNHELLHRSIQAWGETHRDGVLGKERIVLDYASVRPSSSTVEDDFVGRMLWALCDKSGKPARMFAEFVPAPSLDWLIKAFSEDRYVHGDLARFDVSPCPDVDEKLRFSLMHRPSPYRKSLWMSLVPRSDAHGAWDPIMQHLAQWMVRHLNDPELVFWIVNRGGALGRPFGWLVERQLEKIAELERAGNDEKLKEMREKAFNSIPSQPMRRVWSLLLSGRVKSSVQSTDLYSWCARFKREGLTASTRLALRELLAPRVQLRAPYRWTAESALELKSDKLSNVVECEIVLNSVHVQSTIGNSLRENEKAFSSLLRDFECLLRDALDLLKEIDKADEFSDRSHWDLPSISAHWQNRGFHDWTFLAEALRDSWQAVNETDSARAALVAEEWFSQPYPLFKRLALHGASLATSGAVAWVRWLVADGGWWLWSVETRREVCRLLVLQGANLPAEDEVLLEAAILSGPPRRMFRDEIEAETPQFISKHGTWVFLSKLRISGAILGQEAQERWVALSDEHKDWKLDEHEREEFTHWSSGSGDPVFGLERRVDVAPRKWRELASWLGQPAKERSPFDEDTWAEVCRTLPRVTVLALREVARTGQWPVQRWRTAFQEWYEPKIVQRSWMLAAGLVAKMPPSVQQDVSHAMSSWLESVSKSIEARQDLFLELSVRFIELPLNPLSGIQSDGAPIDDPVMEAINHPVGHVTNGLVNFWFGQEPSDGDKLPDSLRPVFSRICEMAVERYRHGRVIMCAHAISFFRVDRDWSEQHLLPLFSWSNPVEARCAWEGFLWSPRLYQPFFKVIKRDFLDTAARYGVLGKHSHQFAAILTYAALEPTEDFSVEELRAAIHALPQAGLEDVARVLAQAVEGAGEQREAYWRNRVVPFWKGIWPKSRQFITVRVSDSLANLSLNAGSEFPAALELVRDWLMPLEHPYGEVLKLQESKHCQNFPQHALQLLSAIIADPQWVSDELGKCLDEIIQADPLLRTDPMYMRLQDLTRR